MPNQEDTSFEVRYSRFEVFEERLALSVQPIAPHGIGLDDPLDHHFAELTPLEPDFQLAAGVDAELNQHQAAILPHLATAHGLSGVEYVHSTYGFDGSGQTVAIIDSGIAYDHLSLGAGLGTDYRVVGGYDFAEGDADPYDDGPAGFHGTHVAGIVGSDHAVHSGVASGVDLVALRVFDDDGAGYFSWVEQALGWVHENRNEFANPITTVNLSLGTSWNSDSIPGWTQLEDDFAQLEAAGIFISVSAGNSFQEYGTPGLSYPAASPSVVPVASVDDNGNLSSFSQRHDRVLAAPGRGIVSTVPDYIFGGDGNPNDFGSASGTSMAAPYVAGASVLVRQAMEFVGISSVTQDAIYDHLRNTADVFYDAATAANYHRINVQAALDALMPADEFGSSAATAHQLGTLSHAAAVSGVIGTVNDADYFTFTASAAGQVTFTVQASDGFTPNCGVLEADATLVGNSLMFDVEAGEQYTLYLQTQDHVGHYEATLDLAAVSTTVKTLTMPNGAELSLDSDGWLSINGRQVWNRTQDFHVSSDGTLYWLGTSGLLQRRLSDGGWLTIGSDIVKFSASENGTVLALDADDWLRVNNRQVWNDTQDFAVTADQTLIWHSTGGLLQKLPLGGSWHTIDSNVVEFAVSDQGVVYSLDAENWLSVNGRQVWGQTQDFLLSADQTLFWQSTWGLLQQRLPSGTWQTIDTNVTEFAVRSDGSVFSLRSDGAVSINGSATWSNIVDISTDDAGNLLLEETNGNFQRSNGPFGLAFNVGAAASAAAPESRLETTASSLAKQLGGAFLSVGEQHRSDLVREAIMHPELSSAWTMAEDEDRVSPVAASQLAERQGYFALQDETSGVMDEYEELRLSMVDEDTGGVRSVDLYFDQHGALVED